MRNKLLQKGFSLIELMVAVAILAFVVFGIFQAYSTGFMGMADARDRTVATNYARGEMESIKNKPFETLIIGETPLDYKEKFSISTNITNEVIGGVERNDLKRVITTVTWKNRREENREVELEMLIYGYI
ncbi:prepilin-type N-terminal cleavage/methylation domain-containing protein [Candidatus Atribacteria bacterium 1244-E10-H5-B2]|nr:MAG: prepilin-type N-terminal cleavage/methylation domain-containing protein [Candidatus Atribacteria bacterium 1244-E10-H5-B2]